MVVLLFFSYRILYGFYCKNRFVPFLRMGMPHRQVTGSTWIDWRHKITPFVRSSSQHQLFQTSAGRSVCRSSSLLIRWWTGGGGKTCADSYLVRLINFEHVFQQWKGGGFLMRNECYALLLEKRDELIGIVGCLARMLRWMWGNWWCLPKWIGWFRLKCFQFVLNI